MVKSYPMLLRTTNRRSGLSIVWFLNIYSSIDIENIFNLISKLPALITQLSNVHNCVAMLEVNLCDKLSK